MAGGCRAGVGGDPVSGGEWSLLAVACGFAAAYLAVAWMARGIGRAPVVDVASLECDAECHGLMPHEVDGVLAVCIGCGGERLVPLPLPSRDTHHKDTP